MALSFDSDKLIMFKTSDKLVISAHYCNETNPKLSFLFTYFDKVTIDWDFDGKNPVSNFDRN